jgi:hypothetical protein
MSKELLKENIEKSEHDANFLCDDLRAVLNHSNSVQAIIVLDLIKEANELRIKIKNFQDAVKTDEIIADHS